MKRVLAPGGGLHAVLADLPTMLGAAFVCGKKSHRVIAGLASERAGDLITITELAE